MNNLPFVIVYSDESNDEAIAYAFASDLREHGLPVQVLTVDQIAQKPKGSYF